MLYPKNFLDEIQARIPVSEIVGSRIKIQKAGNEFKACCPFHSEKTPSFTINDQKGFYHCFGCGAHGDVISFLTNHDKMSFKEAVEQLATRAGIQIPKPSKQQKQQYKTLDRGYKLLEAAASWFEQQLLHPNNQRALLYMLERGISKTILKTFKVGYAPSNSNKMIEALSSLGYSKIEMEKFGLIRKSTKKQGEYYAFFRDRIIFPVFDIKGRVVAFGGRILPHAYGGPNPALGKTPAKYMNSSDSEIFHKGTMLYGHMQNVRRAIANGQKLVIVEGYMDVIALAQFGYIAAVAPLGTALTENQIEAAWRLITTDKLKAPIVCFDGDTAGMRAATRAIDRTLPILKPDHSLHFAFLPNGHDPDSLIRENGKAAFNDIVAKPLNLFSMLWEEVAKDRDLKTPESLAGFKDAITNKARYIANKNVQDLFIKQIEKRFREEFLSFKYKKFNKKTPPDNKFSKANTAFRPNFSSLKQKPNATNIRLKILFAALLNYPELFDDFGEIFGMTSISDNIFKNLKNDLIDIITENPDISANELQEILSQKGYSQQLQHILNENIYMHANFVRPNQYIDAVKQGCLDTLSYMQMY